METDFISLFRQLHQYSLSGMCAAARALLPRNSAPELRALECRYPGQDSELLLNQYLACYAPGVRPGLEFAFHELPPIAGRPVEIYDWGTGQGVATVALLDYINRLAAPCAPEQVSAITLIEPSHSAIDRAACVLSIIRPNTPLRLINKRFDDLRESDFQSTDAVRLHLFSHVLDVEQFDLVALASLIQRLSPNRDYFVCVSPRYGTASRQLDFLVALDPEAIYVCRSLSSGTDNDAGSVLVNVFARSRHNVTAPADMRAYIERQHCAGQYFAGYISDAIADECNSADAVKLLESLAVFDVHCNLPLRPAARPDSHLTVLANMISRGLPTRAPVLLERLLARHYGVTQQPAEGQPMDFVSNHRFSPEQILQALHVVDPRFVASDYNEALMGSSFESDFIEALRRAGLGYMVQLLEPQRPLSSLVAVPNRSFAIDQRVDFALEIPYGDTPTGFIAEVDGQPYHSNIYQRLNDNRRDDLTSDNGWSTTRINNLADLAFVDVWRQNPAASRYLAAVSANCCKPLEGQWRDMLEVVLAPLAVARVERMLVEALLSGALSTRADRWNIAVVERDLPCAAVAVADFRDKYENLHRLSGTDAHLPEIHLVIVSTAEFRHSPLHMGHTVVTEMPSGRFDLCMDVSVLMRDNIDRQRLPIEAGITYVIRSSHYSKTERTVLSADNISYSPLVERDHEGLYHPIDSRVQPLGYFLAELFRKPGFLTGQLPILSHILADRTTIGLLPTGGGKSLIYQLAAMLQPGVTIVVDPLISLMMDQHRSLLEARIDSSGCINSSIRPDECRRRLACFERGTVQIMLLSPERFMMNEFRHTLISMTDNQKINFAYGVIDEVHCVSEWGHDFRASYLHLGRNMINFMSSTRRPRPLALIGLTATASFDVLADVERELTLGDNLDIDPETIIRPDTDERPELVYRVETVHADFGRLRNAENPYVLNAGSEYRLKELVNEAKQERLEQLLRQVPDQLAQLNSDPASPQFIPDYNAGSFYFSAQGLYPNAGIVFCPYVSGALGVNTKDNDDGRKRKIAGVSDALAPNRDLRISTFVGGDDPKADMSNFVQNRTNLMVGTKAFGMGIDKPNVRFTVNMSHPASIEGFVQEAGRAGRDRRHAISYILYEPTEYVWLTTNNINDIRYYCGAELDPQWLVNYKNKCVLTAELEQFCRSCGASDAQTAKVLEVVLDPRHNFVENVDRNVDLWFHNLAFRGVDKELEMMRELTHNIRNVHPTQLTALQNALRDATGSRDLCLKYNFKKTGLVIFSGEDHAAQYGFVFLNSLRDTYNFVKFDITECQRVGKALVAELQKLRAQGHTDLLAYLSAPLPVETDNKGICQILNEAETDRAYVVLSWDNQLMQDADKYKDRIIAAVMEIARQKDWPCTEAQLAKLNVDRPRDFNSLLSEIVHVTRDPNWLIFHGDPMFRSLRTVFCSRREKADTDKAIYRLCCIGLVEDVTVDYAAETYELIVRRCSDAEYRNNMLRFFRKYYSQSRAEQQVEAIDKLPGRDYLEKCMVGLTRFVYENLERKRRRAIEDIHNLCEDSRNEGSTDASIAEFIHLYFNSKYARRGYMVGDRPYSLSDDTDQLDIDDFNLVLKYIDITTKDSSGSEVDNVKHLYGATLLCLRAHPDSAALQLLRTYCIVTLGPGTNDQLKRQAKDAYIEGFTRLGEKQNDFVDSLDSFNRMLLSKRDDAFVRDELVEHGCNSVLLVVHEDRFNKLINKYVER